MVCAWEASLLEDLALEENTVAYVVWDSQGCMDFELIVYSTEGTLGQELT